MCVADTECLLIVAVSLEPQRSQDTREPRMTGSKDDRTSTTAARLAPVY